MNRNRKIQAPHVFAARVAEANRRCWSHRQERADVAAKVAALAVHTHQPKRGEPGYVYRGPPMRQDFRLMRAGEWGHEADAEHRLRWGLPG